MKNITLTALEREIKQRAKTRLDRDIKAFCLLVSSHNLFPSVKKLTIECSDGKKKTLHDAFFCHGISDDICKAMLADYEDQALKDLLLEIQAFQEIKDQATESI